MPSKLWYGEQAFWVSNGTKDLLYEAAVEVAKRGDVETQRRLADDPALIGCYNVSGMGFDLEAFARAFGGKDAWRRATEDHFDAVETLCPHRQSVELMTKLFRWIWFVLDGGGCNTSAGEHPALDDMPELPERE
jgi:hypothetical protein